MADEHSECAIFRCISPMSLIAIGGWDPFFWNQLVFTFFSSNDRLLFIWWLNHANINTHNTQKLHNFCSNIWLDGKKLVRTVKMRRKCMPIGPWCIIWNSKSHENEETMFSSTKYEIVCVEPKNPNYRYTLFAHAKWI